MEIIKRVLGGGTTAMIVIYIAIAAIGIPVVIFNAISGADSGPAQRGPTRSTTPASTPTAQVVTKTADQRQCEMLLFVRDRARALLLRRDAEELDQMAYDIQQINRTEPAGQYGFLRNADRLLSDMSLALVTGQPSLAIEFMQLLDRTVELAQEQGCSR